MWVVADILGQDAKWEAMAPTTGPRQLVAWIATLLAGTTGTEPSAALNAVLRRSADDIAAALSIPPPTGMTG